MKILVVEDDPDLSKALSRALEKRGYAVSASFDGLQAFQLIKQKTHDLIILDLNIPGEDGLHLLQRMRSGGIETPVLVLEDPTAGVDVGARAEIYALLNQALERGVAVLVISTDFEEIAHICNRALVFNRGRVSGELLNEQVTFANLLHLACADEVPEKASSDINPLATA